MFHIDDSAQFLILIVFACIVYIFPIFLIGSIIILILRFIGNAASADRTPVKPPVYLVYKTFMFKGVYWTVINIGPKGELIIESELGDIRTVVFTVGRPRMSENNRAYALSKGCRAKYGSPCSTDIGIGSERIVMYREE